MVARCLVESKGSKVPVRLLNPTANEIIVASGTPVACVESVGSTGLPTDTIAGVSLSESSLDQEKHDVIRALVDNCDAEISEEQRDSFYELFAQYTDILASSDSDTGRKDRLHH